MQLTLDNWLHIDQSKDEYIQYKFPTYFYLNWSDKTKPYYKQAVFLHEKPTNITFECNVTWMKIWCNEKNGKKVTKYKKHIMLNVCGSFPNKKPHQFDYIYSTTESIPLLKSNIQKCVRRLKPIKAVKSTYALMTLDMIQLLRRLPIIMIEDAMLHTSFTTLIWMMIGYDNNWELSDNHVEWILGLVKMLCDIKVYDIPEHSDMNFVDTLDINTDKLNKLDKLEYSLVMSMLVRRCYGGMKGDVKMLDSFMYKWLNRFNEGKKCNNQKISYISNLTPFNKSDIELSAVDFHCFRWMIKYIVDEVKENHKDIEDEDVKNAIWWHRSSLNFRKNVYNISKPENNNYKDVWDKIVKPVTRISYYLLNKQFDY